MEVDPLTVFLARGEKDSPVGELVSTLVQMCPWHVPPLVHGGVVPDAWDRGQGKTKLGPYPRPRLFTCLSLVWPRLSQAAGSFHIGSKR